MEERELGANVRAHVGDDDPMWSYLGRLALRTAPPGDASQGVPRAETISAAVLFADIAGFTKLTSRLAAQGRKGADELTAELTDCFGRLIDLAELFGGDVYRFAGDAIVAVWPTDPPDCPLAMSIERAARCSLAIQRCDARLPRLRPRWSESPYRHRRG